jgi:hypothetical protein
MPQPVRRLRCDPHWLPKSWRTPVRTEYLRITEVGFRVDGGGTKKRSCGWHLFVVPLKGQVLFGGNNPRANKAARKSREKIAQQQALSSCSRQPAAGAPRNHGRNDTNIGANDSHKSGFDGNWASQSSNGISGPAAFTLEHAVSPLRYPAWRMASAGKSSAPTIISAVQLWQLVDGTKAGRRGLISAAHGIGLRRCMK